MRISDPFYSQRIEPKNKKTGSGFKKLKSFFTPLKISNSLPYIIGKWWGVSSCSPKKLSLSPLGQKRKRSLDKRIKRIAKEMGFSSKEIAKIEVNIGPRESSRRDKNRLIVNITPFYLMTKKERQSIDPHISNDDLHEKIETLFGLKMSKKRSLIHHLPIHQMESIKSDHQAEELSSRMIKGFTIRHELAHIKNRDTSRKKALEITLAVAQLSAAILLALGTCIGLCAAFQSTAAILIGIAAAVSLFTFTYIALGHLNKQLLLKHSRYREKQADLTAIKSAVNNGQRELAIALARNAAARFKKKLRSRLDKIEKNPALRTEFNQSGDVKRKSTHPKLMERISYLEEAMIDLIERTIAS